jgi:hypothetical protein
LSPTSPDGPTPYGEYDGDPVLTDMVMQQFQKVWNGELGIYGSDHRRLGRDDLFAVHSKNVVCLSAARRLSHLLKVLHLLPVWYGSSHERICNIMRASIRTATNDTANKS